MCIVLADTSGPQLIASRIKVCGTYLYKDPAQQLAILCTYLSQDHPTREVRFLTGRFTVSDAMRNLGMLTVSYHPFIVLTIAYTVPTC